LLALNVGFKGMLLMALFLLGCGLDKSKLKLVKRGVFAFTLGFGIKAFVLVLFNWLLFITLTF